MTATKDGDPTNASPAEAQQFRDRVVSLRSILVIEEQLSRAASARYKKALE